MQRDVRQVGREPTKDVLQDGHVQGSFDFLSTLLCHSTPCRETREYVSVSVDRVTPFDAICEASIFYRCTRSPLALPCPRA